jgi:hypothetical protein
MQERRSGRAEADLAPSRNGGTRDGRCGDRGSGGAADPAVDRVKREVEQLERMLRSDRTVNATGRLRRGGDDRPRQRQLRHAIGQSALALAPPQVRRLQQALTTPQRVLLHRALREARSLMLDHDRER